MTVGWIREGDTERFFEATTRIAPPSAATPDFPCIVCGERCASVRALSEHLQRAHARSRPALLISGREPASRHVLRTPTPAGAIVAANATSVQISEVGRGRRFNKLADLERLLHEPHDLEVDVELRNDRPGDSPVLAQYRLLSRVPSDVGMTDADRAFAAQFGREAVTLGDVEQFRRVSAGTGGDYAEGLADYVIGVLLKDRDRRTGVDAAAPDHAQAYSRALRVLESFDRPLPRLVCTMIRFARNDFDDWATPTLFPPLDAALAIFGPMSQGVRPRTRAVPLTAAAGQRPVMPIDAGADHLLRAVDRVLDAPRWSALDDSQLAHLAGSGELDGFDRAKARALWAYARLQVADAGAAEPLRLLIGHEIFGCWADAELTRVGV